MVVAEDPKIFDVQCIWEKIFGTKYSKMDRVKICVPWKDFCF